MANGTPATAPVLPFTTGSPGMDSIIRSAVIGIAGFLTGIILTWLNKHGVMTWLNAYGVVAWLSEQGLSIPVLVGGAVFSALLTLAGAAWGFYQQNIAKKFIVDHVVTAAATGQEIGRASCRERV